MTDSESEARALTAEAHALHHAVFDGPAPEALVDSYLAAHRSLWAAGPPPGVASVHRALERGLDLEALELAWRLRGRKHALVQKFQVLVYLAEALPEYQARLVGEPEAVRGALLQLSTHALRSAWKLAKGTYLIRRHRLG